MIVLVNRYRQHVSVFILFPFIFHQFVFHILTLYIHNNSLLLQPLYAMINAVFALLGTDGINSILPQFLNAFWLCAVTYNQLITDYLFNLCRKTSLVELRHIQFIKHIDCLFLPVIMCMR